MQIGQILVEQGWVDPAALARALADQPQLGRRICSLLILRGELDADNAARALSLQHGVPGVLQRHLEHRDLTLTALLPGELARGHVALPIGRTSSGSLIVCVRDPSPEALAAIAAAVTGPAVVAVAPAYQLEHLVAETYHAGPSTDDLVLELAVPGRPAEFLGNGTQIDDADDIEVDLNTRRIPVIGDPLDHLGTMTLVELDDARVAKDPSQSGQHSAVLPRTITSGAFEPPRTSSGAYEPRTIPSSRPPPRTRTRPSKPGGTLPLGFRAPGPDAAIAAIEGAASIDDAADAAMAYLAGRFHRAVWFAIHEGAALGERGCGDQLTDEIVQAIAIPLAAPSILQVAHVTRRLANTAPPDAGPIQDRLWRTLGAPRTTAALPVPLDAGVAAVIAVGDPIGDPAGAPGELARLGQALAAALRRMAR
jgi:hypothetical protein